MPGGHDAREALADDVADARDGGLPQHRGVDLAGTQIRGNDLDRLIEDRRRFDLGGLDDQPEKAMRAAALRRRQRLAVEPSDRLLRRTELRRIGAHHDHVAALARRKAGIGHQVDRSDAALGRRDDRRHVSQVADLLLVREHLVDDDRALQRVLKLDFAARRKVLFPQLQCPDHHRRVRDGVVGLIAHDQLDRLGRRRGACGQCSQQDEACFQLHYFAPDDAR